MRATASPRIGILFAIALFVIAHSIAGCGSGDGLSRQKVSGSITLDGSPLATGTILFRPADASGMATPAGAVIAGGSYSIPRDAGPIPGRYRVSISSPEEGTPKSSRKEIPADEGGPPVKDRLPARYNSATELEAEVTEGGTNVFDYPLTTKK